MKLMNTKVFSVILLCILPCSLFSFDWPVHNGRVVKNFGQNGKGLPERGMLFLYEDSVFPADTGEVLFVSSSINGRLFASPLGNWMAIQHQDSIIGIYSHLSEINSNSVPSLVEKSMSIAKAGTSGWATQPQLQFTVFDRKTSGYVNPQLLINMIDQRAPLIRQTILANRDGQKIVLGQLKSVRQGTYRVYIDANDGAVFFGNNQVAPYQFTLFVNGMLQGELELDLLAAKNGSLQVGLRKSQKSNQVYQIDGTYFVGEIQLNRGKVLCEVVVSDAAGNQKSQTYQFIVE